MTLDRATRNALARMVGQARERLKSDVMDQLRRLGFQDNGSLLDLDRIAGLTEEERAAGVELRALLEHFVEGERSAGTARRQAAYDRLAREIGFTTLNRLAALRMAEERGLIVGAVGKGLESDGFRIFESIANGALGGRAATYRAFLELLYDELALDLPLLFDRGEPTSRIFPGERCLEDVLALLDDPALAHLWSEDETIGWIYQYYNDPDERRKMREAPAPRNSRELAVRNQFFTPRYVVEFLTDNTLGRIWWEMQRGETSLADRCALLVRRKRPSFLAPGESPPAPYQPPAQSTWDGGLGEMWTRPNPAIDDFPAIWKYALTVHGADYAARFLGREWGELANELMQRYRESGTWEGTFEELRCCLFFEQRRYRHFGWEPESEGKAAIQALHRAICERWDLETEFVAHRAKKDPREITVLDPACGSGHFLLYAFDLLETIYAEAYDDPDLGPTLQQYYPDRGRYDRLVPTLILRHNLHGVDIDPRACQIAALALWLRAQRSFQGLGLMPTDRPRITRSNIACAEPMPGERALLEEYLQTIDERLRPLVRTVWEKMQLAGEAGTLLKIEAEIEGALSRARIEALVDEAPVQATFYQREQRPSQARLPLATREERRFWEQAEEKLLTALQDYATSAADNQATQRWLFAEDATQGFALIDLLRKRFDVVLMNPPFGEFSAPTKAFAAQFYSDSKSDIGPSMLSRGLGLAVTGGLVGAITSRLLIVNDSLSSWREATLLSNHALTSMLDLGYGVLDDAMVEVAALVVSKERVTPDSTASFIRVLDELDKEAAVYSYFAGSLRPRTFHYVRALLELRGYYAHLICYWLPPGLSRLLLEGKGLSALGGNAHFGASTSDDFQFARLRWEVSSSAIAARHYVPFAKGGEYKPYFDDISLVLEWSEDGKRLKEFVDRKSFETQGGGGWRRWINGVEYYFREGLTFPERTTSDLCPQILPRDSLFSAIGSAIHFSSNQAALSYLGAAFSRPFKILADAVVGSGDASVAGSAARHYRPGIVNNLPVPCDVFDLRGIKLVEELIRRTRSVHQAYETSWEFTGKCFHSREADLVAWAISLEAERLRHTIRMIEIGADIETRVIDHLRLSPGDIEAIDADYGPHPAMW
ncbi:MAG TPA: DNA methyltransferase [Acidimicrobiales bacterium]|nr:DNA methyltransferase [Acidimicrobiales bacterium]